MSSNSSSPQSEPPVDGRVPVTTGTPPVPAPPPGQPNPNPNPNAETLIARLRAQVEFYFSQQNLARDVYLRNLLAQYGGSSVPLLVICQFPKVQKLCASFNVGADPSLVKHSLEGSNVVYVTPDANWISPMQALPPLDPKVNKLRPLPLGPRSMSVSSVQDESLLKMNGKSSAPSSPSKGAKASGPANMPGAAGNGANANGMHNLPMQHQQGQPQHNGRPAMVTRSHSSAAGGNQHQQQPAHYHPNNGQPISMTHPPAQGMSVPGPGQAYGNPSPYPNYQYRMPPPGNYQQPGYVYSHLQPPPPGAQMRYPQVYPGYAYVPTSTGPPGYYSHGRPVMVRGRSTGNTNASGNYENGQRRQGPGGMNMGGGARNRPDGPKQIRKNRNKKGLAQNYDSGTGSGAPNSGAGGMNMNMSRRGSKGELNSQHSKPSDGDLSAGDMNMLRNSHRSQNDMSDSSGGGKMAKRKKNKNKRDGNGSDRRKDVSFDANQFPALSPSSPTKMKTKEGGPEKVAAVGISGYAAALLQKKTAAPTQVVNTNIIQGKELADEDETDVVAVKVDNLNLSAKDDENGSTTGTIAVGALTGTPLTESSVETADEEHSHGKPIEADTVPVPATNLSADIEDKVENDGPTPREAESFEMSPNAEETANAAAASLPLVKDPPPMAAPPVAWGNKRTFIDVVRKQS